MATCPSIPRPRVPQRRRKRETMLIPNSRRLFGFRRCGDKKARGPRVGEELQGFKGFQTKIRGDRPRFTPHYAGSKPNHGRSIVLYLSRYRDGRRRRTKLRKISLASASSCFYAAFALSETPAIFLFAFHINHSIRVA